MGKSKDKKNKMEKDEAGSIVFQTMTRMDLNSLPQN
jgi:hypothetical protein